MAQNWFDRYLSDKDRAALADRCTRRPDVREQVKELHHIATEVVDVPVRSRERELAVILGLGNSLGQEARLTVPYLAQAILGKRECDTRCADELAAVIRNASDGLKAYYCTTGRDRLTEVVIQVKPARVIFRDRAATIYLPDLPSRNPFVDQGLSQKLPNLLAARLEKYYGVRVRRQETGAGAGPLFRVQGHFARVGERLTVGITVSSLTKRTVISDRLYRGFARSPQALIKRICGRVIADLQGSVEIALVPKVRPAERGDSDITRGDVRRAAD